MGGGGFVPASLKNGELDYFENFLWVLIQQSTLWAYLGFFSLKKWTTERGKYLIKNFFLNLFIDFFSQKPSST